jgi:hypothetical protein
MAGARKDVDPQLAHNQRVAAEAYVLYKQDKQAGLAYFDEHIIGTYGLFPSILSLLPRCTWSGACHMSTSTAAAACWTHTMILEHIDAPTATS